MHNVFSCACTKEGRRKAAAIKGRNLATEKNMKGTVMEEVVEDHVHKAWLLTWRK